MSRPNPPTRPFAVRFRGHRYVLAVGDSEPKPKKRGPKTTRVHVDECTGEGIYFDIEILVQHHDGAAAVPGLTSGTKGFKVQQINKLADIPVETRNRIASESEGEDLIARVEKILDKRPGVPIYFIQAKGGWDWSKRNGDRDVAMIQQLLEYMRSKKAALYLYCKNRVRYGDRVGLL